ncbi:glycolipid transfer protein [Fragilaria crotonensis]|nr:glycolipid transfer protein [Fragilaria crotonensis]
MAQTTTTTQYDCKPKTMSAPEQNISMLNPSDLSCSSLPIYLHDADRLRDKTNETLLLEAQFWIGLVAAFLAMVCVRRWYNQSKSDGVKRSKSGLFQIARESSAASLATFKQVSSSASFARLSEAVRSLNCFKKDSFVPTISAPDLFIPPATVKNLSLKDISLVIKYAIQHNRADFDESAILADASTHVEEVVAAMDAAVIKSRGVHVLPSTSITSGTASQDGNVDALYFCAAMRLFVEWRAVKITPEEYKAYAVGMNVAKRDFIQNTSKVEDAVHRWIESEIESGKKKVAAPTVRQLLESELVQNVHTRLPRLNDNTAATGIIWMTRQLLFQTEIFSNVIQVPDSYKTGNEAIRAAYKTVFNPYHGWAIQQVFNYAFNGAPPVSVIFEMLNPQVVDEMENQYPDSDASIVDNAIPEVVGASFISSLDDSTRGSDDEDMASCFSSEQDVLNPFQKFGNNIKKNWDIFAANTEKGWTAFVDDVIKGGNMNQRKRAPSEDISLAGDLSSHCVPRHQQLRRPSLPRFVLDPKAHQLYVESETTKAAHMHIGYYLTIVDPLLREIRSTIEEFGMNDPTKV